MFENFFFNDDSLSSLVPVAIIIEPNELNFSTKLFPIPPVAPVIKTFLFFKFIN